MPTKPSYDELVRRLEALEEATQPQTLAQTLEKTWAPRGGEPRIIDAEGRTLDYVPAVQLKGGTSIVDTGEQRVVFTPAPATASKVLPDKGSPLTENTAVNWYAEDGSGVKRAAIQADTADAGNLSRRLTFELARDLTDDAPKVDMVWETGNNDAGSAGDTTSVLTARSQGTDFSLLALRQKKGSGNVATAYAQLTCFRTTGSAQAEIRGSRSGSLTAFLVAEYNHFNGARIRFGTSGTDQRFLFTGSDETSQFMQVAGNATVPAKSPLRRVTRGPFTGAVSALAAGATTSFTLTAARAGTDYVVMGGPNGAAGAEELAWSWADSGSADVAVTVRNTSAGALTATLRFYVISTS